MMTPKERLRRLWLRVLRSLLVSCHRITRTPSPGLVIPCWNCSGMMRQYAEDSFYYFYECPGCGKEKMEHKEDYPGRIHANDLR